MNTLILENEDFLNGNTVKLYGRRAKHILEIKKLTIGSTINAGLINGNLGTATVKSIGSMLVILEVSLKDKPPAPLSLSLVIALPSPKVLKKNSTNSCLSWNQKNLSNKLLESREKLLANTPVK